jgi:hypothetical protein
VRGTDFWGGFTFPLSDKEKAGNALDVIMLDGKFVYVTNDAGITNITVPGTGTTVEGANSIPTKAKKWSEEKLKVATKTIQSNQ